MDDQENMQDGQQQQPAPSKKDVEKQQAKEVFNDAAKTAGAAALEAYGVPAPVAGMAVDKIAENPLVKKTLNTVGNQVARNPLARKTLSKAKPLVDTAKPLLNAKGGKMGGGAAGAAGTTNVTTGASAGAGAPKPNTPDTSSSPLGGGLGSLGKNFGLGGGDQKPANNQGGGGGDQSFAESATQTAMKIKKYWPIISAVAPFFGWLLLAILGILIILMPILYITENIEKVVAGVDKFINFINLNGFKSSGQVFFDRFENEYKAYDSLSQKEGEFDVPILAATVYYGKLINLDEKNTGENNDYEYKPNDPVIPGDQTISFYVKAYDQLGKARTLIPSQRKLIGHLVDTKFTLRCVPSPIQEGMSWWEIFSNTYDTIDKLAGVASEIVTFLREELEGSVTDTGKDIIESNIFSLVRNIIAYAKEGGGATSYFGSEWENFKYDFASNNYMVSIMRMITNTNWTNPCAEDNFPVPVPIKFINYDLYKDYLKKVYLPVNYINCGNCNSKYRDMSDEDKDKAMDVMINEIFDQRDAFQYLINKYKSTGVYGNVPSNLTRYLATPVNEPYVVTSCVGWRPPIYKDGVQISGGKVHNGIDVVATGADNVVHAVADGEVIATYGSWSSGGGGEGNYVIIEHSFPGEAYKYITKYFHLASVSAQNGPIKKGDPIGIQGTTGNSTGDHLHFELWRADSGVPMNPANLFKAENIREGTNCVVSQPPATEPTS